MRLPIKYVFGAAAILALAGTGNLALAQQPGTTTPAPAAGAPDQPSGTSTMTPGHMEHEKGMNKMGHEKGMGMGKDMGSTTSGQSRQGPMGGMPSCPSGQTASGTPSTCK
ncbi:MAG: hypothetical protein Q7V53_02135 [Caldisericota bacterium]|nr:hypothetical protein [Caldisericota bacterium]